MAKKTKPQKPPKPAVYSPGDWASLDETRARLDAEGLHRRLCSGELPAAVEWVRPDGIKVFDWVDRSAWQRQPPDNLLGFAIGPAYARARYFVDRKKLDRFSNLPAAGGKPGPSPEQDWKRRAGREIAGRALAGAPRPPTGSEMCTWCGQELHHDPDLGEMQELIGKLRFLFDEPGQPGPTPKDDWRRRAGLELVRRAIEGLSAPGATSMLKWCGLSKTGSALRHMQRLIHNLRFLFDD
jgi:hypothetical protein